MSYIDDIDLSIKIGDVEITLREIIFSITISAVLFLVGFLIASKIEHHVNQRNLQYRQAAQIPDNNKTGFDLAMKTDVGNAFVEGWFESVDKVTHEKIKGEWTKIYADYQKYTMHTRVVHYTVTDSKGRTHTRSRTETYWTWDTYKTENVHAKMVNYIGSLFLFNKFDYSDVHRHFERVDNGHHKRIEFTCIPKRFRAASYTKLSKGTVSDGTELHQDYYIEDLYKYYTTSHAVTIFWVIWGIFIALVVVMFVALDNAWIEDNPDEHKGGNDYGYYGGYRNKARSLWR